MEACESAGADNGDGNGKERSFSYPVISAVGTSVKLESSAARKRRVFVPITRRCSWRILNPLRRIANSEAAAGRASKAQATAHKNTAAFAAILAALSVANGLLRIILFGQSQAYTDRR